jgi:30S ribosomal protein S31
MGKGDKRTKRGKITIGSYGKSRPHKVVSAAAVAPVAAPAKAAAPKADKKKKA